MEKSRNGGRGTLWQKRGGERVLFPKMGHTLTVVPKKKRKKFEKTYFGSATPSSSLGAPSGTARISETERVGGGRGLVRLFL